MRQRIGGAIPSPYDVRDYKLIVKAENINNLPQNFCLPLLPVKNQGIKPTCVAHSLAEIIEYHNYIENNKTFKKFSTEFIYGCREKKDYLGDGMLIRQALKNIRKYGDVLEQEMPGNNDVNLAVKNVYSNFHKLRKSAYENRISTYYKINNPNELKIALYKHGPVAAGIKIYDNFSIPNNIYHYDKTQPTSGHAVMIIGWTKKYWIVQNSWGKDWGDKGKFFIPIDKSFKEVFFEAYGVTDNIFSIKTPNKIIKKYNKPINKIINSFEKIKNFCYNIYRKENVL